MTIPSIKQIIDKNITGFAEGFFDLSIRFHPVYLLPFLIMALLVYQYSYKKRGETQSFLKWAFPRAIYFHPSHIVDIKLFILGRILAVFDVLGVFFLQVLFAAFMMNLIGNVGGTAPSETPMTLGHIIAVTLLITIVADFCVYWVHRIHHEYPVLWPFHSVHHSAEVMTPVTVYRKHPLYDLFSNLIKAVLIGFTQGILLALFFGKIELYLIAGANVFYVIFNALGSNFRHSHIWLSYGPKLEHILISPAQHQVHHSLEPKHHNKNYGEIFALWDWMFGTLYVPQGYEEIKYGISKSAKSNIRIEQPHKSLKDALIVPFIDSHKAIKRRMKAKQKPSDTTKRKP